MIKIEQNLSTTLLNDLITLWLEANIEAHAFIPAEYWHRHVPLMAEMLPQAEIYTYSAENGKVCGFIGLSDNYIAGIFVSHEYRGQGIGKQLLNVAKTQKDALTLSVYLKNKRALSFYLREDFSIQSEGLEEVNQEKEVTMVWTQAKERASHPARKKDTVIREAL